MGVFFSGNRLHAEEKVIQNIILDQLHISFSPCSKCVEMFGNFPARLSIQFSWVYKHPKGCVGIGNLLWQGYKLEPWNTSFVLDYLLNQAPSDGLRQALLQARHDTKDALFDRDMETQRLVMDEYEMYFQEGDGPDESDEEEEEEDKDPYWTDWANSRQLDDEYNSTHLRV